MVAILVTEEYASTQMQMLGHHALASFMTAKRRINEAEEEGSGPDSDGEEGAREDDSCDS